MRREAKLIILGGILLLTLLTLWWIESRRGPAERYRVWIDRYSREAGLDPDLVEAVVFAESRRKSGAVSYKGAVGLMQLMPSTAQEVGARLGIRDVDSVMLKDPQLNLRLGVEYLAWLRKRYDSLEETLAAYNAGPGRLAKWKRAYPDLPPKRLIEEIAYEETRAYVARVLTRYRERHAETDSARLDP